MKSLKYIIFGFVTMVLSSCSDILDVNPKGALSDDQFDELMNSPEDVEKMVIAAYALVENDNLNMVPWLFSDVRSGDSYKGGGGTGDMAWVHNVEVANTLRSDESRINEKWTRAYIAIFRANNALVRVNALDESVYPEKKVRSAEMRFLRAHQAFEIKRIFKHIVWVDETVTEDEFMQKSNVEFTDQELWNKIIADFRFAADNLPVPDEKYDVGRAHKYSAKAYLAKALLYAAYEQNDIHEVININKEKLEEVVTLVTELQTSGRSSKHKYDLADDFAKNFLWEYENGPESIFAIQSSHDDDTHYGRLNQTAALSYPTGGEYGCCGFHTPSQDLVNAFKTNNDGLPIFDDYNDNVVIEGWGNTSKEVKRGWITTAIIRNEKNEIVKRDTTINQTQTVDPRLLHTVAMPGLPYKYKEGHNMTPEFSRDINTYGYFLSLKETVAYDCSCFRKAVWYYSSSLNRDIIRFDDALLWKAEALIELGGGDNLNKARDIINDLRSRAARSTGRLTDGSGNSLKDTGVLNIATYNTPWTNQEDARQILRWERRLEMALEASRGFDLTRWGIATETLNEYYASESKKRSHLGQAHFTKNKDEYFPIPHQQISFSKNLYKQNPGWED